MKNKKRIVELGLAMVFLAAGLAYIYRSDLKEGLQLVLQVKVSREDTFRLYIGGKKPLEAKISHVDEFRTLRFLLPREKIENLRLNLGDKPGTTIIERITVKNLFRKHQIKGKLLPRVFWVSPVFRKNYVKDRYYYIETTHPGQVLIPGDIFYRAVENLQRQKTSFYLLWVILSGLVFYFLHYFDLKGLKAAILVPRVWVKGFPVLIFVLSIFLPLVDQVFNITKNPPVEKRTLAPLPEFRPDSLVQFTEMLDRYYNDHFPFRTNLIFLNNLLKVKLLGISPTSKVLIGKDGWLFFDDADLQVDIVDYYRSLTLLTPGELEKWKNLLEQRFLWLKARGIDYLFVIAPEKSTIYPEFMPNHIRKVHRESRMDQLIEYLGRHSRIPFLDLRPALIEAKKSYPVYWKTDTHWSEYGAYIAYREIVNYISRCFGKFKGAEPLPLSRFKIEIEDYMGGDLAAILMLHGEIMREKAVFMIPGPPFTSITVGMEDIAPYIKQIYTRCSTAPLPNILMVHDSFYHRLKPFLSEQFARVLYIWDWGFHFFPVIIQRENPKLVIDEMAERFLMGEAAVNPEGVASPAPPGEE